jgi:protein-disulfide isomerase
MASLTIPVGPNDHIQGDESASVVLVEYGDYQCPHCGRAHPIVKRVQNHFGDRLAFVFRNFPLNEAHPFAEMAAESAEFAGAGGQFWEMHDAIFENQEELGEPMLVELAESLGLSGNELKEAIQNHTFATRVKEDFRGGVRSGVNGTPTFYINGERHEGAFGFEDLVEAIEARVSQV